MAKEIVEREQTIFVGDLIEHNGVLRVVHGAKFSYVSGWCVSFIDDEQCEWSVRADGVRLIERAPTSAREGAADMAAKKKTASASKKTSAGSKKQDAAKKTTKKPATATSSSNGKIVVEPRLYKGEIIFSNGRETIVKRNTAIFEALKKGESVEKLSKKHSVSGEYIERMFKISADACRLVEHENKDE